MRRRLLIVAAVALAAAAPAAATLPPLPSGSSIGDGVPFKAYTTLTPPVHLFGDPVTASIAVVADTKWVDPSRLRVTASFRPYQPVHAPTVLRLRTGRFEQITWTWTLRCLSAPCVPRYPPSDTAHIFRFPLAHVDYLADQRQEVVRDHDALAFGDGALGAQPGRAGDDRTQARAPVASALHAGRRADVQHPPGPPLLALPLLRSRARRRRAPPRRTVGAVHAAAARDRGRRCPPPRRRSNGLSSCSRGRDSTTTRRCSGRRSSASPTSSAPRSPGSTS